MKTARETALEPALCLSASGALHTFACAFAGAPATTTTCPCEYDVRMILIERFTPAIEAVRKEEREACARIVEESYPCSCDEGYMGRKLTDPACFKCNPLDEAAYAIRNRS